MPEPNTLTPSTVFQQMNYRRGRTVPLWDEILRILRVNLPPMVIHANATYDMRIPTPRTYGYATMRLDGEWQPAILVASSTTQQEFGTGYCREGVVTVFCAYPYGASQPDLANASDLADICEGILGGETGELLGPHADPQGRVCWQSLTPAGVAQIPRNWPEFAGLAVSLNYRQTPGSALWYSG